MRDDISALSTRFLILATPPAFARRGEGGSIDGPGPQMALAAQTVGGAEAWER